jgi:hypothetical protein
MNLYRSFISPKIRLHIYRTRHRALKFFSHYFIHLTDPSMMFMRSRLENIHGVYAGKRCFIMGNGPSLNKMDLEFFKDEIVWGSNRCYLLFDQISWRPNFYTAVDTRVVPDNAEEINGLSNELNDTVFFFPSDYRYSKILKSNKNVYWFKQIILNDNNLPFTMFSTNVDDFIYSVRTVTITALQLAVFLGFNPIYLIGCDTSYQVPKSVKFENGNSDLLISTKNDPNHFSPEYFGEGKKWHDPHVDRMIFHYKQAKKVCDEIGVKVYNATVGGNLEVFPRVDYRTLFL